MSEPSPADDTADRKAESARRFNLSLQRSRAVVYLLGVAVGLLDRSFGELRMSYGQAPLFLALSLGSALVFHRLYGSGLDRRRGWNLFPVWISCDVALISLAVYLSADSSAWFIWYLAATAAAAFVGGNRAALAVGAAGSAAYVVVVALLGPAVPATAHPVGRAALRLVYLYGSAFFLLRGISSLRSKREQIQALRRAENRKLAELERTGAELRRRAEELDQLNTQLRQAAITDTLTGLHNRRFLETHIATELKVVQRAYGERARGRAPDPRNSALGCLLIDVDQFKRVNDTYGHDVGDEVLRGFAEILRSCARANDTLVRWGGEEFMFVARQTNPGFLPIVVKRVLRSQREREHVLPGAGGVARVTCSVGWSYYPLDAATPEAVSWEQVVKLADLALYLAKHNGRDLGVGIALGTRPLPPGGIGEAIRDLPRAVADGYLQIDSTGPLANLTVEPE